MIRSLIISVLCIFLLSSELSAQVSIIKKSESSSKETSIDKIFEDFDDPKKPGAAVAVLKEGEVIFKKGYGSANLEYGIPVSFGVLTVDTIEQAIERSGTKAGNKGEEAAASALEMVSLLDNI